MVSRHVPSQRQVLSLVVLTLSAVSLGVADEVISTVAGGGPHEVPATSASVGCTEALATDGEGNIYFTSMDGCVVGTGCPIVQGSHRVYRVDPTGRLTVFAGRGPAGSGGDGGPAPAAGLSSPMGVAVDTEGNVYVSDTYNHRIRRVDSDTGIMTTVGGTGVAGFGGDGGLAVHALLRYPTDLALDSGGSLVILDRSNNRVRRVDAVTGIIQTIAGDGSTGYSGEDLPATSTGVSPDGIGVDAVGQLFIAEASYHRVRRVDAVTGLISTVAGDGVYGFAGDGGPATQARFKYPRDVVVDPQGDLFIGDSSNLRIRRVSSVTGQISTAVLLNTHPNRVALDRQGRLVVPRSFDILLADPVTGTYFIVAGNGRHGYGGDGGPAISAVFDAPISVAVDATGNVFILVVGNRRVRSVAATGEIATYAGGGPGGDGVPALQSALRYPRALAVEPDGDLLIAETAHCELPLQGHKVRRVDAVSGLIHTVAGTGSEGYNGDGIPATMASLRWPIGMATDTSGNIFIADLGNSRIRRVDAATGLISTVAGDGSYGYDGDDQPATQAALNGPIAVAAAMNGDLYIADRWNHRVRKEDSATGLISTNAGTVVAGDAGDGGPASSALVDRPFAVVVGSDGRLFIADASARLRQIDLATGIIATLAGDGTSGFSGDGGPASGARVGPIWGLTLDAAGNLYAADKVNNRVRRISSEPSPAGTIPDGSDPYRKPLTLEHAEDGMIRLSWGTSCLMSDQDYVVYSGVLGDFASHQPMACSTGGATAATFSPVGSDAYYLVVPRNPLREGSYGMAGDGTPRPPSTAPCLPRAMAACGSQAAMVSPVSCVTALPSEDGIR